MGSEKISRDEVIRDALLDAQMQAMAMKSSSMIDDIFSNGRQTRDSRLDCEAVYGEINLPTCHRTLC